MTDDTLKLASEFPSSNEAHWRKLVEAALKSRSSEARPDDVLVAQTRVALGRCLVAAGRFEEAQTALASAYPVLAAQRETHAYHARDAAGVYLTLYSAWNKPKDAAMWRQKMALR